MPEPKTTEPSDAPELKSTEQAPDPPDLGGAEGLQKPSTIPYNADEDRERMRGRVALLLIGLLAATVISSFTGLVTAKIEMKDLKELLTIVFGPLVALVGAATGFYFGGKK